MNFLQLVNPAHVLGGFVVLFALIDVLGSLPVFLGFEEGGKRIQPFRVTVFAFCLLLGFLFLGQWILQLFHVDVSSFAVAGSIVIFIVSIEMVFGVEVMKNDAPGASASLVPIAFPLIAGPATFTALLSMRAEYHELNIIVALLLNMTIVYFVLRYMGLVRRVIGAGGVYMLRKFFGVVLMAIAVKLFTSNITSLVEAAGRPL